MSDAIKLPVGKIVWRDLTVADADGIRQFYEKVVGWESAPHDMDTYHDFDIMSPDDKEVVTGICHARDSNANLPPVWLLYVAVADVTASAEQCVALGGMVLDGPRQMGANQFCVIQDPAGAVCALMSD